MDEVQEGDDRGEERRLIQERTDATTKAHMRRRRRISEFKKASKPKKPQWCCTALGPTGISSIFLFDLSWFIRPLLVPSSSSYLSSFSSLLSPGCVGEISRCFSVLQKMTTGGFSRIYRQSKVSRSVASGTRNLARWEWAELQCIRFLLQMQT